MIDVAYYTAFILVFLRILSFFIVVPVFFPKGTPNILKVAFSALFSLIILSSIDYSGLNGIDSNFIFIIKCMSEVITGLLLGYLTNLCFFSIRFAGQLIDMQIGFAMINMFDPTLNSNSTLLEHTFYLFGVVTYFVLDAHHILIKELVQTFNILNLGEFILSQESAMFVIKTFIDFFILGFKIAIPIILIILLTDLVLGLVARTVPQLNVMILGLPLKILVGLTSIAFMLPIITKCIITIFNKVPSIFNNFYKTIPFLIIFASEDKTEKATPKKKSDARKKGQVAKSKDVNLALTLLACTLVLAILGNYAFESLGQTVSNFLSRNLNMFLNYSSLKKINTIVLWRSFKVILPLVLPIMLFGILANFLQTGFIFTGEPLKPDIKKLNPINGLKRMFSMRSFMQLLKDSAIIFLVGYAGYNYVKDNFDNIMNMSNVTMDSMPGVIKELSVGAFYKITKILLVIALIDYIFQRYQYNKDLKMTKQEVKEEFKQMEGDPQVKGRIRQIQREMASKRMMQQIPDATVVVTNPTHIAVALKYIEGEDDAPVLVAKGADYIAIKIKEIAKDEEIPIIEDKPLARLIYEEVELDSEIPVEMYNAVAEILALVFKLRKRK